MRNRSSHEGATALVTGSSSGLGRAFAVELARRGANVVLVARRAALLEELATRLRTEFGVRARVVVGDLTKREERESLIATLADEPIEILVNNAGVASYGQFTTLELERELEEIELNCAALVHLSHHYLPLMVGRGSGGIINVASVAGFAPCPNMATYAATKAFVLSFSLALSNECAGKGPRVLAFCPGPINTEFAERANEQAIGASPTFVLAPKPESLVPAALRAYERGDALHVPRLRYKTWAMLTRVLPRQSAASLSGLAMARGAVRT